MAEKNTFSLQLAKSILYPKNGVFVMGILNATPDSFFSGSRISSPEAAANAAREMEESGVDIIDIGAESSRPSADYISPEEECRRLLPVIQAVRRVTKCPISIDTRHRFVFEAAFNAGADILNDISALEDDASLAEFAAQKKVPVILMHKRGIPADMMQKVCYTDIVQEITAYFAGRIAYAHSAGIADNAIILDPGIGFSKKLQANCRIIRETAAFSVNEKYPVLIGGSRKTCVGELTGQPPEKRLSGTIALHMLAAQNGAAMLRVHDVRETVDMLKVMRGIESDII